MNKEDALKEATNRLKKSGKSGLISVFIEKIAQTVDYDFQVISRKQWNDFMNSEEGLKYNLDYYWSFQFDTNNPDYCICINDLTL